MKSDPFMREEKKKKLKIRLNRTNRTGKIPYMSPRDEMKFAKSYTRDFKIQRPTLFNRVLLPVDFYFDSILPSHLSRFFQLERKIRQLDKTQSLETSRNIELINPK